VALSRVKRLDTLSLLGINRMALKVSEDALAIDETLQTASAKAEQQFAALNQAAAKRAKEKPKDEPGKTPWAERLATMRQTHPNAFKPWRAEEDNQLLARFKKGDKVTALSTMLGRQPGAIRARLKKHLGDDVFEKHQAQEE
jgi:hypothetical protein